MYGIPSYSQNVEKAMQFLNLMYTDKDIVNLLTYGIEGVHYAKVTGSDNIIDYAPGVTDETSGYSLNSGFQFGNQFLSYIWNGDPATIWEETDAMNKSAQKSVALGFIFDATNVKTQYTNVTNVISQYKNSLENGVMDPDIYLPEFISKLKEAGIDEIVSEKQKQLDEWLAASK